MNAWLKKLVLPVCAFGFVPLALADGPAEIIVEDELDTVILEEGEGQIRVVVNGERDLGGESRIVAFVGIGTEQVSPALASQLGLDEGLGLLVELVVEDSPAAEAGLEANDVLVKFNDQLLVNTEQLTALIRMNEPGDTVELTLIRRAEERTIEVELGEQEIRPSMIFRVLPGEARWAPEILEQQRAELAEMAIDLEVLRDELGERHPFLLERNGQFLEMENEFFFPGVAKLPTDGKVVISDSAADGSAATVTRDEDGLRFKLVEDGEVVFDGPVETEEQREELTDEQLDRLEYLLDMLPEFEDEKPGAQTRIQVEYPGYFRC
ncbi:MAG: PDZ domain-containing protein [Planctomycetota bacterium]